MDKLIIVSMVCAACDLNSKLPDRPPDASSADAPEVTLDAAVDAPAVVACHGLTARTETLGLWCFDEETGTTTANRAGCAGAVTGIVASDWEIGGGIRPVVSQMRIPDATCLDVGPAWEVEAVVDLDDPTKNQAVLWRADHSVGAAVPQWVRLSVTNRIFCEVGRNNNDAYNALSAIGSVPTGVSTLGCRRAADGTLDVFLNGVNVTATRTGTTQMATVGDNVDFTVGYTDAPASIQPETPLRVQGVIRAIAIHADVP